MLEENFRTKAGYSIDSYVVTNWQIDNKWVTNNNKNWGKTAKFQSMLLFHPKVWIWAIPSTFCVSLPPRAADISLGITSHLSFEIGWDISRLNGLKSEAHSQNSTGLGMADLFTYLKQNIFIVSSLPNYIKLTFHLWVLYFDRMDQIELIEARNLRNMWNTKSKIRVYVKWSRRINRF